MKKKIRKVPIIPKKNKSRAMTQDNDETGVPNRRSFLNKILPETGHFCVVVKTVKDKRTISHHWYNAKRYARDFVRACKSKENQVFVAQASFKTRGTETSGRSQENVAFMRNFFLDVDCGPGKPYATQTDGEKAVLSFCKRTGLPNPALVNSGNGLYAHWPLTTEVNADIWKTEALKLKKLVIALEPGLDNDGLIADSARILRPVGAINLKDPKTPKRVKLLRDCEPVDFGMFKALLDGAATALPTKNHSSNKVDAKTSEDRGHTSFAQANKIAEDCPIIANIKQTKGNVPEPLWYAGIGVLRYCAESPQIIHEWSSGHPDYSIEETDAKIAQHRLPPTTCRKFAEICPEFCGQCTHYGKLTSPITLGATKEIPDYIKTLNSEYFIGRFGGRTVVCRETYDEALKRRAIETSTFQDFKNLYNNRKVTVGMDRNGTPMIKPLGTAWLDHEARRQYMEIKMLPEGADEGVYNLWRGFSVEPVEGSWKLMKRHIHRVICNSDKKLFNYVIRWLARMVQKPWKPGEVALVLQGGKGVGKGMLGNAICDIMGQHACHVMNVKHVTGDFNGHLEDCIFLFADEAFWAGDKAAEGVLKGMITEPTVLIVRKFCEGKQARNMMHIFMASNNEWVVPASKDERRYCVLKVSERYKGDHKYFKALADETYNGGLEAMLYYLKNLDIRGFNVRAVPETDGLTDQKIQSLDSVMVWWLQKLRDGELLPGYKWGTVSCKSLYDDYVSAVQKIGGGVRRANDTAFGMQLRKALPDGWPKKTRQSSQNEPRRTNHYSFPSLKDCRKAFKKYLGIDSLDWR